jgi:two-component system chemotaxis response regulator CheB
MIRVLVIDDSATVRELFRAALSREPDIEVVGEAPDPYVARQLIAELSPDVLTLDMEMPRMDGLTFLRKVMEHAPLPVVVVSSITARGGDLAVQAFEAGAVEVLQKPGGPHQVGALSANLIAAVRAAAASRMSGSRRPRVEPVPLPSLKRVRDDAVLAIGASTGGTIALEHLLRQLPANAPPTLITQHMPPVFTRAFAERLDQLCEVEVREAQNGDALQIGTVLLAPGGKHLLLRRQGLKLVAEVRDGPKVSGHCPSVDVLFRAVARAAGAQATGVILTGMGADGARGLLEMREAGAATFAQDEESCVVYGMPRAAVELGAVEETVPLWRMAHRLMQHFEGAGSAQTTRRTGHPGSAA